MEPARQKTVRKATFAPLDYLDWNFEIAPLYPITDAVSIEFISGAFGPEHFALWRDHIPSRELELFRTARYALAHRFSSTSEIGLAENESQQLLEKVFICLRLIKPTRSRFFALQAKILDNSAFEVVSVTHQRNTPLNVPDAETLNFLSPGDVALLRRLIQPFLDVAEQGPENLRRAIRYFEQGYSQTIDPVVQIILWTAGIEALFSKRDEPFVGPTSIKEIEELISPELDIYEGSPHREFVSIPPFPVKQTLRDLFSLRHRLVHGGWISEEWKTGTARPSFSQAPIPYADVLREAASFVLRKGILQRLLDTTATAGVQR